MNPPGAPSGVGPGGRSSGQALHALLFGDENAPRFVQSSPIQADVWLAFDTGKPEVSQRLVDLLLVPDWELTAGAVARALRTALAPAQCNARIAQLPGIVAVRIDFAAFMRFVVPQTTWWSDCSRHKPSREWLRAVSQTLGGDGGLPEPVTNPTIGRIGLNRTFTAAALRSSMTVKADAARRLFDIDCSRITWAVLDTGIRADHPAFRNHSDDKGSSRVFAAYDFVGLLERLDQIETRRPGPAARTAVFDRLRRNLKAEGSPDVSEAELDRLTKVRLKRLRDRLQSGRDLDWALLEPMVKLSDPEPPRDDHGTQVGGIIAADWRPGVDGQDNPPDGVDMVGMCPNIRLLDMRVLSTDTGRRSTEFDIIAALQFLRFLNDRSEQNNVAIHGANLSLSTPHDVRAYGCGATLVCQECDRLSASGIVVVTCAGNGGYDKANGEANGRYVASSITDPGNAASVITVGATHATKPHRYGVSWFSSRGPTGDGRHKPDLVAPGERIAAPRCDTGDGREDTGTSFAAPHVSGAAALLIARNAELAGQPSRIKDILCATATDLGRERHFQGAGLLDTLRALQSV